MKRSPLPEKSITSDESIVDKHLIHNQSKVGRGSQDASHVNKSSNQNDLTEFKDEVYKLATAFNPLVRSPKQVNILKLLMVCVCIFVLHFS